MQTYTYRFRPKLIPTLATLILLPVLINLGLWQSHKADSKQALQDTYDTREKQFYSVGYSLADTMIQPFKFCWIIRYIRARRGIK
jgi:hypothetical protein